MGRRKRKPDRFIEPEVRAKVKTDAEYICFYCGKETAEDSTVDHYIPFSRGGSNDEDNLVCACRECNELKDDMMPEEFRLFLYNMERYEDMAYGQLQKIYSRSGS